MNTKIVACLTVSGIATGILIGGVAPIILLSGGLTLGVTEMINTLKD